MSQNVNHHPSISLLELYCDGSLTSEVALLVATHLEFCPHCQQLKADIETDQAQLWDETNDNADCSVIACCAIRPASDQPCVP